MLVVLANSLFCDKRWWTLSFRRSSPEEISSVDVEGDAAAFAGIRCPICRWRPTRSSTWFCSDCGHPEYFYNGCGTEWNSFETRGRCPTCAHQWVWTSCLSCYGWSKHVDWYE